METFNTKYIFLSSYVYGPPKYLPIDIHHPPNPHNDYSKIKLKCEKLCKQYSDKYNISSIILRLFNIYGKKQRAGYIFSDIINQIENNKIYVKNLNSKRDFLHVSDLTSLIRKIIINNFNEGKIFNVGSGKSTSINEITEIFVKLKSSLEFLVAQTKSQEEMKKERWIKSTLIKDCYANIKDLEDIYNWQPKISIEEGIKKLLNNDELNINQSINVDANSKSLSARINNTTINLLSPIALKYSYNTVDGTLLTISDMFCILL